MPDQLSIDDLISSVTRGASPARVLDASLDEARKKSITGPQRPPKPKGPAPKYKDHGYDPMPWVMVEFKGGDKRIYLVHAKDIINPLDEPKNRHKIGSTVLPSIHSAIKRDEAYVSKARTVQLAYEEYYEGKKSR
jgi:hypothetical protein